MWSQSYRSLAKAENWSGSAPWQVVQVEGHVEIGPLSTAYMEQVIPIAIGRGCHGILAANAGHK